MPQQQLSSIFLFPICAHPPSLSTLSALRLPHPERFSPAFQRVNNSAPQRIHPQHRAPPLPAPLFLHHDRHTHCKHMHETKKRHMHSKGMGLCLSRRAAPRRAAPRRSDRGRRVRGERCARARAWQPWQRQPRSKSSPLASSRPIYIDLHLYTSRAACAMGDWGGKLLCALRQVRRLSFRSRAPALSRAPIHPSLVNVRACLHFSYRRAPHIGGTDPKSRPSC